MFSVEGTVLAVVITTLLSLMSIPILVWMERRVAGFIQDRLGPNRSHIFGFRIGGVVQSFADMIKLVFKEELLPKHIKNRFIYTIAPAILFGASYLTFAVIPYSDSLLIDGEYRVVQLLPVELGVLWFIAFAGLSVYGLILAGWSSHSKYGILGSLRATAQVISYEISMGLVIVSMLLTYGTIYLNGMVDFQGDLIFGFIPAWGIIIQPLAGLIFIITAFAETNRAPFDVAEGESEIVAGYHTEYSAMKFALFFMGEYVAMAASSALIVTLFFGGYHLPWIDSETLLANPKSTIGVVMFIIFPFIVALIFWMRNANRIKSIDEPQHKRETKYLTIFLIGFLAVSETLLALLLSLENSQELASYTATAVQIFTFILKVYMVNFIFIWVRWTLPRFRYDQIQYLSWNILLPLAILNVIVTAILVVVLEG
jgi:NADH-quinone oxidoreductase subunit H